MQRSNRTTLAIAAIAIAAVPGCAHTDFQAPNAAPIAGELDSIIVRSIEVPPGGVAAVGRALSLELQGFSTDPNVLTARPVTLVASGGGLAAPNEIFLRADGRFFSTWVLGKAPGPQSLTATLGRSSRTITVQTVSIEPTRLAIVRPLPSPVHAGDTVSTVYQVLDQFDNPVGGIATYQLSPSWASAYGLTAPVSASGVATFRVIVDAPKGKQRLYPVGRVGSVQEFEVLTGTPRSIEVPHRPGFDITANAGSTTIVPITILDAGKNPVPNEVVSIAVISGSATAPSSAISGDDGIARAALVLPSTPGRITLRITAPWMPPYDVQYMAIQPSASR